MACLPAGLLRNFRDGIESGCLQVRRRARQGSALRNGWTEMFGEINPRTKARAPFISVEEALEEIRRGRMLILMDDEERENEGDLCMAAEKVTAEAVNFMAKYGRGLICLPMSSERADQLGL